MQSGVRQYLKSLYLFLHWLLDWDITWNESFDKKRNAVFSFYISQQVYIETLGEQ